MILYLGSFLFDFYKYDRASLSLGYFLSIANQYLHSQLDIPAQGLRKPT